jgi:hypothetical protein
MTDSGIHVKKSSTWVRLAYMVFFGVLIAVGRIVLGIVVVGQFLMVLITGNDNDNLRNLGQGLAKWIYQGILFLTFNTDAKPFPFDEWPEVELAEGYSSRTGRSDDTNVVDADAVDDDSSIPSVVASDEVDQPDSDKKDQDA